LPIGAEFVFIIGECVALGTGVDEFEFVTYPVFVFVLRRFALFDVVVQPARPPATRTLIAMNFFIKFCASLFLTNIKRADRYLGYGG
jgi:hypothetical protein